MALVRICGLEEVESVSQLIIQLREGTPINVGVAPRAISGPKPSVAASPPLVSPGAATSKKKYEPAIAPATATTNGSANGAHAAVEANGHHEAQPAVFAEHSNLDGQRAIEQPNPSANSGGNGAIATNISDDEALRIWRHAAEKLGGLAGEKASQASAAAIHAPNQLVVTFAKRYNFCRQFCERPEIVSQLNSILEQMGAAWRLEFRLADDQPSDAAAVPERATTLRQRMYEACQRPFVRQAMELFDATAQRLEEAGKS